MKTPFILLVLAFFSFQAYGQKPINHVKDSLANQSYFTTDLALITGYQIHKNHFAEFGIGIKRDGIVGHHPSTIIYGVANEIKLDNDFIWG
jgi:hypothetical protein